MWGGQVGWGDKRGGQVGWGKREVDIRVGDKSSRQGERREVDR